MIAQDYRLLKAKGVVEISAEKSQPEYIRPIYNSITGNVAQSRVDSVDITALTERRAALVEEIKDIDAFLADVSEALSEKAATLNETKETP